MAWSVILKPAELGVIVAMVNPDDEDGEDYEVSRVAYARRNSKNPDTVFDQQLTEELRKAELAADEINALWDDFMEAKWQEIQAERKKLRELLGPKPKKMV